MLAVPEQRIAGAHHKLLPKSPRRGKPLLAAQSGAEIVYWAHSWKNLPPASKPNMWNSPSPLSKSECCYNYCVCKWVNVAYGGKSALRGQLEMCKKSTFAIYLLPRSPIRVNKANEAAGTVCSLGGKLWVQDAEKQNPKQGMEDLMWPHQGRVQKFHRPVACRDGKAALDMGGHHEPHKCCGEAITMSVNHMWWSHILHQHKMRPDSPGLG